MGTEKFFRLFGVQKLVFPLLSFFRVLLARTPTHRGQMTKSPSVCACLRACSVSFSSLNSVSRLFPVYNCLAAANKARECKFNFFLSLHLLSSFARFSNSFAKHYVIIINKHTNKGTSTSSSSSRSVYLFPSLATTPGRFHSPVTLSLYLSPASYLSKSYITKS